MVVFKGLDFEISHSWSRGQGEPTALSIKLHNGDWALPWQSSLILE
jgi:hypothetical protein